jgi:hypothetical protein
MYAVSGQFSFQRIPSCCLNFRLLTLPSMGEFNHLHRTGKDVKCLHSYDELAAFSQFTSFVVSNQGLKPNFYPQIRI